MKRKLLLAMLSALCLICALFGLSACGEEVSYDGTYYQVIDGVVYEDSYVKYDEYDDWEISGVASGEWCTQREDGSALIFTYEYHFFYDTDYLAYVNDNILTIEIDGEARTYYREGTYTAYTVTYRCNGGTIDGENKTTAKVLENYGAPEPAAPDREGYTFLGWSTSENSTTVIDFKEEGYTVTADATLYAAWSVNTYTATFIANGAVISTVDFTVEDSSITEPQIPEVEGYTAEWPSYTLAAQDITITADYDLILYTITYNNTKGAANSNLKLYCVENNTIVLENLSANGYVFLGWYDDNGSAVTQIEKGSTGDVTLTAQWQILTYNISYEKLKGNDSSGYISTYTVESSVIILPTDLTATGYRFSGWLDENGNAIASINTGSYGDKVLTANFTPITYSIDYRDTRSAANANPASYTIESDTITLAEISANGYNFIGWYNGETKVTQIACGSYGDLTLTAKWEVAAYTITYANTKQADTSGYTTTYTMETPTFTLPVGLTSTGYTFAGWYNGDTKVTQITLGSYGDITLTAKWNATAYNIAYENVSGAANTNPSTYTIESSFALASAVKAGYNFLGWYNGSEKVTNITSGNTGAITLTASWELVTYTITYANTNGASTEGFVSTYTIESETITLPTGLTHVGATFVCWLDESGNAVTTIADGSYGNKTFTAKWNTTQYTITYENVSGATNSNPATYTIESSFTLASAVKTGYTFLGWYNGSEKVTNITSGSYGNITLTASWEATVYSITYNNIKEADDSGFVTSYTIESASITLPQDLTTSGATFVGWLDANGNSVTAIAGGSYGNVTLTASWQLISYAITYEGTEGAANSNPDTYTIESAVTLTDISRVGYTFLGWYDESGAKVTNIAANSTGDITLTAKWEILKCTVTYNTQTTDTIEAAVYNYGDLVQSPSVPTYSDKVIGGWYTDSDCTSEYSFGAEITSDITLYAKWIASTGISTVTGFKNILSAPDENYHLLNDIDFTGTTWAAITTFSGTLYGCGYTISGLTVSSLDEAALFVTNNGTITNLYLSGLTITVNGTSDAGTYLCGGIAVYNEGVISDCHITGTTTVTVYRYWNNSSGSKPSGSRTWNQTTGLLCAVNSGTLSNCSVSGTVDVSATCRSQAYCSGAFTTGSSTCKMNFYFGCLAGENKGKISGCTVTAGYTNDGANIISSAYGINSSAYSTTNAYIGALVGKNSSAGTIENTSGTVITCTKNNSDASTTTGAGSATATVNVYMDTAYEGLIGGENEGTLKKISFLDAQ